MIMGRVNIELLKWNEWFYDFGNVPEHDSEVRHGT